MLPNPDAPKATSQQSGAEDAERNRHRKFTLDTGERGDRKRHNTAADLDCAGKHNRIGRPKHLQQRVKKDNGDDASNQGGMHSI